MLSVFSKTIYMDLSKDIKSKYNLEDEISGGNAPEQKKEEPKKKIISPQELQQQIADGMESMNEAEQIIRQEGYGEESILMVYEAFSQALSDRIKELREKGIKAPEAAGSAAEEKKAPEENKNPLDYIYDFEKFPPLTCKFLGPGQNVLAEGRQLKTWLVEDIKDKHQWLLPQWSVFSEVQGNFLGFQSEDPGKYIYQINYKGIQDLPEGRIKFLVDIYKKFPQ